MKKSKLLDLDISKKRIKQLLNKYDKKFKNLSNKKKEQKVLRILKNKFGEETKKLQK